MSTDRRDQAVVPFKAISGVLLSTRAERELAVGHWLLSAALNVGDARAQWAEQGTTGLRCGGIFAGVRIPGDLVHAAAGTSSPGEAGKYLAEALHGGPVLVDRHSTLYYALVPASTARWWNIPDSKCLGLNSCLGVPRPDIVGSETASRSYWAVPMDSPGVLCVPDAVSRLVTTGRSQRATAHSCAPGTSPVIAEPGMSAAVEKGDSCGARTDSRRGRAGRAGVTNRPPVGNAHG